MLYLHLLKGTPYTMQIQNGETGNTYIYRRKKGKTPSYGIGCTCGTIPRHTA